MHAANTFSLRLLLLLLLLVVLLRSPHVPMATTVIIASSSDDRRRIHSIFFRSMEDWRHQRTAGINTSSDTKGELRAVRCLTFD